MEKDEELTKKQVLREQIREKFKNNPQVIAQLEMYDYKEKTNFYLGLLDKSKNIEQEE